MTDFLNSLTRDTILSIAGLIFGIIGIILAIVFYFKGKKSKKPYYLMKSFNIISDNFGNRIEDIEILFKGQKIKDLTVTKIVIWNSGNETINKSDIPETTKFGIGAKEEIKIYDIEIIENTDTANNITLINHEQKYLIDFDFIDPNQGIIIKVTHSGKSSEDIIVDGRVKGGFELEQKNGFNSAETTMTLVLAKIFPTFEIVPKTSLIKYFALLLGIFCLAVSILSNELSIGLRIGIGIIGGIYFLFGIILISEKQLPKYISKKYNDD